MVDLDSMERATRECVERTLAAYVECAIWASTDESGDSLDYLGFTADDLADEARESMLGDVADFLSACWDADLDLGPVEPGQFGHDFWLTRNHHGAGFWDRGTGELGDTLTDMAHAYGSSDLYIGDDGRLYVT